MMDEIAGLAPGLQCCLRCGRVITNRELHDSIEEPALASIRRSHPEWAAGTTGETCQPCLSEYRKLLSDRQTRSQSSVEATRAVSGAGEIAPNWFSALAVKLFGRTPKRSYGTATAPEARRV